MHIIFASSLGFENVYPAKALKRNKFIHGQIHLGQKGLLEFLELHTGLFQRDYPDMLRINAYQKAIEYYLDKSPNAYIAKSFENDPIGSSKQILKWRDELQLALWDFKQDVDPKISKRIALVNAIEKEVVDLPHGINDRWRNVLKEIKSISKIPVQKVTVAEPKKFIHPFFVELMIALKELGVKIEWQKFNPKYADTDLGHFQRNLIAKTEGKAEVKNDGSLIVLKADNDKLIARAITEFLLKRNELNPLFIIPERGVILEQSMIDQGFPAMGCLDLDEHGGLMQLASIITVFLWEPIDPEKLIQFLALPMAPIDKAVRQSLAIAYSEKAGVKNEHWVEAVKKYKEKTKFPAKDVEKKISKWFNRERAELSEGADPALVHALFKDLKSWADRNAGFNKDTDDTKTASLKQLSEMCRQIIELCRRREGDSKINHTTLNIWLDEVNPGTSTRDYLTEIGAFEYVTHPANMLGNSDMTIWWSFTDAGNPVSNATSWSEDELEILSTCSLHEKQQRIDQWFWQQCQAVLMTQKNLILCVPQKIKGEEVVVNPLLNDLQSCFTSIAPISYDIDLNDKLHISDVKIALSSYTQKELPRLKTHWQISNGDKFEKRERESYSSLSKLFYYPYSYVLSYQLGIRLVEIPDISITHLLKGKIAHTTVQFLWEDQDILSYDNETRLQKIKSVLEAIIKEEGAVFYLPKNESSLNEYRIQTMGSIEHMFNQIIENGWSFLESEQEHTADGLIPLKGYIDLVLQRGNELAIIDLKWGGMSSKLDEMIKEQELQLMIYDHFMNTLGKEIYVHYYIITKWMFLSRTNDAFKNARVVPFTKEKARHREVLWGKIESTYKQRWSEILEGKIEVGDGMFESDLENNFKIWEDLDGNFLTVPRESKKKKVDKYSDYKKVIGK